MVRHRRIGYFLVALGVVLSFSPFVFAGGTQRACPGIESVVYDTVRIFPAGFAFTGIDWASLELHWYDGCNWRDSSLIPLLLGIGSFVVGFTVIRRTAGVSANSSAFS